MLRQEKEKELWDHNLKVVKWRIDNARGIGTLRDKYRRYVSDISLYIAIAIADRKGRMVETFAIKDDLDRVLCGGTPHTKPVTDMEKEYFNLLLKEAKKYRRLERTSRFQVRLEYEKIKCEEKVEQEKKRCEEKLEKLEKLKESMEKVIESMEKNKKYLRE